MNFLKRNLANIITLIRFGGGIAIIFLVPLSIPFYIVYGACGLTDMFDGLIARKLHIESKFGSIIDSITDLFFFTIMAIKIFPTMVELLTIWNWIIIIVPVVLHIVAYIICAFKFKRFSSIHTYANKFLGAVVFCYPFTFIGRIRLIYEIYAIVFGIEALYAAIEITLIHILSNEYNEHNKSIFLLNKNKEIENQ